MGVPVPAGSEEGEDIGVIPQGGRVKIQRGPLVMRSSKSKLVDHLYTLKNGDNSLLEYAVGVTKSHDLKEESLDLWKFKGVRPHECLLALRNDKGGFPPLSALQYFKKEVAAQEACHANLTEGFLKGQSPADVKQCHNEDFALAMEAPTAEEFYNCLKMAQPCDLAMGFPALKAFTQYHYKDTGELPQGVYPPSKLKK
ncbi:unnamed protein product [Rhizoctonia solani]|uniref:Uncharacterized protein n=1 Tax=Rhizoctonia solani TaxID=456999 RepID=A0A8H2W5W1_9AGAM|nr:unnamed protein product [Rhizoctonia solani]